MSSGTMYYDDGSVSPAMRARTFRIRRLELCWCWFVGPLPSRVYLHWPGRHFPNASVFTLRLYRAMLGFRWYDKGS